MTPRGLVVFDLDGTLIDTAPDIMGIANAVLASQSAPGISLAETHEFVGKGSAEFVSRMMAARGLGTAPDSHARLHADFEARYASATGLSAAYSGVADALATLSAARFRLGVCTNKPIAPATSVLAHFGLAQYFDAVAGGDSQPQRKPDPAPLLRVFEQLGGEAAARLYVGDSEVDAATATNAGVAFALFSEGYRKTPVAELECTYVFDNFADLPGIAHRHFDQSTQSTTLMQKTT